MVASGAADFHLLHPAHCEHQWRTSNAHYTNQQDLNLECSPEEGYCSPSRANVSVDTQDMRHTWRNAHQRAAGVTHYHQYYTLDTSAGLSSNEVQVKL